LALASVSPERSVAEIGATGCALSVTGGTLQAADWQSVSLMEWVEMMDLREEVNRVRE
jgi:hypothetical protein